MIHSRASVRSGKNHRARESPESRIRSSQVHPGQVVVFVYCRAIEVVAEAQIEREFATPFEIVLNITCVISGSLIIAGRINSGPSSMNPPQEKAGHPQTGSCRVRLHRKARQAGFPLAKVEGTSISTRVNVVALTLQIFEAKFQSVLPPDPTQTFVNVKIILSIIANPGAPVVLLSVDPQEWK